MTRLDNGLQDKPDVFDKLVSIHPLNIFEPFLKKNKEVLLYLLFGGLAFFLNIGLFATINLMGINELLNNGICWGVCVLFQFFTNRTWVFKGRVDTFSKFIGQMLNFIGGRLLTLAIEEIILAMFITWLGKDAIVVKLFAQIIVIVLNYVISKVFVFKRG